MTKRAFNIAFRTAHIGAMAILLGGHTFNVPKEQLLVYLWLTIGTGVALGIVEIIGPKLLWFHQGRGLMTMGKLLLLCSVLVAWDYRVPIMLAVLAIASVGSHMSAKYRYYSVLRREVVRDASGPGGKVSDSTADKKPV